MDAVARALVAILAQGDTGFPLTLLDLMAVAWAVLVAHGARQILDPLNVLALGLGRGFFILALQGSLQSKPQPGHQRRWRRA